LTDVWLYSLGVSLGSQTRDAEDLISEYGPVRDGFLSRTGFKRLYRASNDETGLTLALSALGNSNSRWWASDVDALIYVTSTGDLIAPGNSHLLQEKLGLRKEMFLLDINDACTGFIRALHISRSLIASGLANVVLLVLSDTYSKLYKESDLKVSPLFSDGASALIVSANELPSAPASENPRHWQFLSHNFLSEGGKASDLSISRVSSSALLGALEMNGAGVFNFVLKNLPHSLVSLVRDADVDIAEVDKWYVHQGSRAVVSAVEKSFALENVDLFRSAEYGNTVGSSLPFQLHSDNTHSLHDQVVGLLAFGVGLTMASMIVRQFPRRRSSDWDEK
jgi:3-oxoacyl-[acyl-carrier-protein] synthase-3